MATTIRIELGYRQPMLHLCATLLNVVESTKSMAPQPQCAYIHLHPMDSQALPSGGAEVRTTCEDFTTDFLVSHTLS